MIPNPKSNDIKKLEALKSIDSSLSGESIPATVVTAQHDYDKRYISTLESIGKSCKKINSDVGTIQADIEELKNRKIPAAVKPTPDPGTKIYTKDGIRLIEDTSASTLKNVIIGQGQDVESTGQYAFSMGASTLASGYASHAEGYGTKATSYYSHAEGSRSNSTNYAAHAEGALTTASGYQAHAEGHMTISSGDDSHAEGYGTKATSYYSHAEGNTTEASGDASHAEGYYTKSIGYGSHSEGGNTIAGYDQHNSYAHAEGYYTKSIGYGSHAEGMNTIAGVDGSNGGHHAEGAYTKATGYGSHSEGYDTEAYGGQSHAEGNTTKANHNAHSEGYHTHAEGEASHAEGYETKAITPHSHVGGYNNIDYHREVGYLDDETEYMFVIGNGTGDYKSTGRDIFAVDENGNIELSGSIKFTDGLRNVIATITSDSVINPGGGGSKTVNPNIFVNGIFSVLKDSSELYGWELADDMAFDADMRGLKISTINQQLFYHTTNYIATGNDMVSQDNDYTFSVKYSILDSNGDIIETKTSSGTIKANNDVGYILLESTIALKISLDYEGIIFGTMSATSTTTMPHNYILHAMKLELGDTATAISEDRHDITLLRMINK